MVALTTLCGLREPRDFVSTLGMPTEVITARTGPPAITPVPSGAGFNNTRPLPKRPSDWCGMVVPSMWILRKFFFAASMPLRMAEGTSLALPTPNPTTLAAGSPITTSAEKLRFLPPFTTLVTRLIETTCSFRLSVCGSIRFTVLNAIRLKLQSGFPCRVRQGLDAAVVDIAAPIEHYLLNAFFLSSPGNSLADGLRRRQIATLGAAAFLNGGSGHQ